MSMTEERGRKQRLWLQKLKKLAAVENSYKQFPLIPEYRPRLTDPSPSWHTFPRQKQAFDFAASHPEEVHVFAFEKDETTSDSAPKGLRRYLITNYPQLWHVIRSFAELGKHATFYEVIPEGAACKLYFDLEFSKDANPEHNGDEMVKIFTEFVCKQIQQIFKLQCSHRHVIDLDASTESKFSRHLIFNLPNAVFKDNINAGNFVQHICSDILRKSQICTTEETSESGETPTKKSRFENEGALSRLIIKDKNGEEGLFVDQGVYTRNRNFRLYKCSKLSKGNPLLVTSSNCYTPKLDRKSPKTKNMEEYHLFLDSVITTVRFLPDIQVLTYEGDVSRTKKLVPQCKKTGMHTGMNSSDAAVPLEGFYHSPYPDVDNFVKTCVSEGGIQGEIRLWLYFAQGEMLIYDISKNRWCGNINRPHKSNNIMILVDLKRGTYYQKCHDPDCRAQNYKSPEHPIPPDCLPGFFDEFDDDELLVATEKAEKTQAGVGVINRHVGLEKNRLGGAGSSNAAKQTDVDRDLHITDEEMLAAVSELEDSGIENY